MTIYSSKIKYRKILIHVKIMYTAYTKSSVRLKIFCWVIYLLIHGYTIQTFLRAIHVCIQLLQVKNLMKITQINHQKESKAFKKQTKINRFFHFTQVIICLQWFIGFFFIELKNDNFRSKNPRRKNQNVKESRQKNVL